MAVRPATGAVEVYSVTGRHHPARVARRLGRLRAGAMSTGPKRIRVVVPEGVDDPTTPSGGNVYDRRLCEELTRSGWAVEELAVAVPATGALADVLRRVP